MDGVGAGTPGGLAVGRSFFFFLGGGWGCALDNERHGRLGILGGGAGSVGRYPLAAFYNSSGFLDFDLFAHPLFFFLGGGRVLESLCERGLALCGGAHWIVWVLRPEGDWPFGGVLDFLYFRDAETCLRVLVGECVGMALGPCGRSTRARLPFSVQRRLRLVVLCWFFCFVFVLFFGTGRLECDLSFSWRRVRAGATEGHHHMLLQRCPPSFFSLLSSPSVSFFRFFSFGHLTNTSMLTYLLPLEPSLLLTPTAPFPPPTRPAYALPARLLSWLLDAPAAPFGVHRMALAGKDVRMWFGPSAAAGPLRTLVEAFPAAGLGRRHQRHSVPKAIHLRTPNQPSDGSNGCCATCLIT
ncbi:hypothetical protein B0H13DRAFT_950131 [Mycena leptocephala]|nr:hypothetical protein B0H13DRAFT_950131 [Mycena leptocephala]